MNYSNDNRIVMTLDAGGTNFVFSAMKGNEEMVDPIRMDANAHDLKLCLDTLKDGFHQINALLDEKPVAISFAFPGPADYFNGIIGDLPNLPAFRGGIAVGPMLQEEFGIPVYINNDGNLYAYGEALGGYLPHLNGILKESGSPKRFRNVIGITLGTGFGVGLVVDGKLVIGDNSNGGEGWLLRDVIAENSNVEEHISLAAVKRIYAEEAGVDIDNDLQPKDIYAIGMGEKDGDRAAALLVFSKMGKVLGEALANIIILIDGVVVIGGGIAGANKLIFPAMMKQLQSDYTRSTGDCFPRVITKVFNLEEPTQMEVFKKGDKKEITVPGINKIISYDPMVRIGVAVSKIGASKAIALGAYAFALDAIDNMS